MKSKIAAIAGVFLAVASVGCENGLDGDGGEGGKSAKASQPFVSGSRLKVRKIVGGDGSEQQLGFRDTQLNLNCTFQKAEDGSQRCLPAATQHNGQFWIDAACTVPAVQSDNCGRPEHIRVVADACNGNAAIWTTKDFSGPTFTGTPGNCSPGGTITNGAAGDQKMMLSAFAEGTEKTE